MRLQEDLLAQKAALEGQQAVQQAQLDKERAVVRVGCWMSLSMSMARAICHRRFARRSCPVIAARSCVLTGSNSRAHMCLQCLSCTSTATTRLSPSRSPQCSDSSSWTARRQHCSGRRQS